jgi:hypothetical protein
VKLVGTSQEASLRCTSDGEVMQKHSQLHVNKDDLREPTLDENIAEAQ